MEQWRTVEDSSGRKEESCTRCVDGKLHTVTRKIDDKGNEEKIEEFKNMDECKYIVLPFLYSFFLQIFFT